MSKPRRKRAIESEPSQSGPAAHLGFTDQHDLLPPESAGAQQFEVFALEATGLLDEAFYLAVNADVAASGESPAEHFCGHGWREQRNPNRYFDVAWYLQQMPESDRGDMNPVLHYARFGERDGLRPTPFFDPAWYRDTYRLAENESPLRHFLGRARSGKVSPIAEFDVEFYLDRNRDIRAAGIDPFIHYLEWGFREGRDPAPGFSSHAYAARYLGGSDAENPLLHYLRQKDRAALVTGDLEPTLAAAPTATARRRAEVAELRASGLLDEAYYLEANADVAAAGEDAAEHFCRHGWREMRNPNRYFDLVWYLQQMPAAARDDANPVLHYARTGERHGLRPALFFDPIWYRAEYGLPEDASPLRHHLAHARDGRFNPIPEFDVAFYLDRNPDIRAADVDPFIHYLECGFREGRDPARGFSSDSYMARHLGGSDAENPLLHHLRHGEPAAPPAPVEPPSVGLPQPASFAAPEVVAALRDPLIFDLSYYRHTSGLNGSDTDVIIDFLMHPMAQATPYFDPVWYLQQNPDAGPAGPGPLLHYLTVGRREGRRPSPIFDGKHIDMTRDAIRDLVAQSGLFDPEWYRVTHADVARAGVDPLKHYVAAGHREHQRSPNVLFDGFWYVRQAPDVAAYGWNPLLHYALLGSKKSLSTHPFFDPKWVEAALGHRDAAETTLQRLLTTGIANGVGPNEFLDPRCYLAQHPDAATFAGGIIGHYLAAGWKQNSDPSERFSTAGYLHANRDVRASNKCPLIHFMQHGRAEGRNPKPPLDGLSAPLTRFGVREYGGTEPLLRFDADVVLPEAFDLRIGVHLHLYYPDMAPEFCRYLQNMPTAFDLFISIPQSRSDAEDIERVFADGLPNCRRVIVRSPPNRGRDIAPFMVEFGKELLRSDLVLHIHTKRSPHSSQHSNWRRFLLHYTLGSRSLVTQILTAFFADTKLGLLQPPFHPEVIGQPKWGQNREALSALLLDRFALSYAGETCPNYPAGSFFWARTDALRPFLDGRLRLEDFEEEAGQIDGTTAHALERLLGLVPILRGYANACRYIDVAPDLVNYYHDMERPFPGCGRDRTDDICRYQDAVRARASKRGRIAVVTALIGGFDALLLPEQLEPEIDYFCVSDTVADGYGVFRILAPPVIDADPRRTARHVKTNLLRLFPGYDFVVWVDANVLLRAKVGGFVAATEASGCGLGAIPHPIRQSWRDEAATVIRTSLDDADVVKDQIELYSAIPDLDKARLIETNFMVFDARVPAVQAFMRHWWNEINTRSRRDQLSINYALMQAKLDWHRLLDEGLSVRDAPEFAMFRHGLNEWGPTPSIYAGWHKPNAFDGGLLPLPPTHRWTKRPAVLALDVVVCVHNALDDVRACLASVEAALDGRGGIVLVDDASDAETAAMLAEFAARTGARLVRHDAALGYTKAANAGVKASAAANVLLLNSDTIVPAGALDKLVDALDRDPLLGIVGPLSNAASWQSVPSTAGTASQTAVNQLPPGMSIADIDLLLERRWDGRVLRTPLVHGFCFCVKRAVFDTIGLFDEVNFPRGYGEENDFCFRAVDAGFDLGVLTSTYVFHAKSKSYADADRTQLMSDGMTALVRKATKPRIARAVETMRQQPALAAARAAIAPLFADTEVGTQPASPRSKKGRLFLLPSRRSDGLPAGSGFVRVLLPYRSEAVSRDWDIVELQRPQLPPLRPSDTVLVQREGNRIELPALDDWIANVLNSGARLVYEVDDDLLDGAALRKRGFAGDTQELAERVRRLSRAAHCVTVSSRALEARFAKLNTNVVFVPNALDADLWGLRTAWPGPAPDAVRRRIRLGYVGTPTHDDDLALVAEVVEALQARYAGRLDVQIIGGFGPSKPTFGSVIALPVSNDYPSFARWLRANVRWDIGIIPLASSTFNDNKSYLKFLECGALGMALVCSEGPEYSAVVRHGETGLLVGNRRAEWEAALVQLIENADERARLARNAHTDIRQAHLLDHFSEALQRVLSPVAC